MADRTIEITQAEIDAMEDVLDMFMPDEEADCQNMEREVSHGKMHQHIYYKLQVIQELLNRIDNEGDKSTHK